MKNEQQNVLIKSTYSNEMIHLAQHKLSPIIHYPGMRISVNHFDLQFVWISGALWMDKAYLNCVLRIRALKYMKMAKAQMNLCNNPWSGHWSMYILLILATCLRNFMVQGREKSLEIHSQIYDFHCPYISKVPFFSYQAYWNLQISG